MSGEYLDLTTGGPGDHRTTAENVAKRKFVGVHFTCCDAYVRVYINREDTAYEGHCPKCAMKVRLGIGPGGTNARFFTAS